MEEDEYKATYNEIATVRCVFEKALTNNQARCSLSEHFCLADREGYSCKSIENASICAKFLENMRVSSRFLLKNQNNHETLPHNMEIRVQTGGLQGLLAVLLIESDVHTVLDITSVLEQARQKWGSLDDLPYSEIVRFVAQFKVRKRGKKNK